MASSEFLRLNLRACEGLDGVGECPIQRPAYRYQKDYLASREGSHRALARSQNGLASQADGTGDEREEDQTMESHERP